MTDYDIGDTVRVVSEVFDDTSQRLSGSKGVVWQLGSMYVWVKMNGAVYPFEAEELEKEDQA